MTCEIEFVFYQKWEKIDILKDPNLKNRIENCHEKNRIENKDIVRKTTGHNVHATNKNPPTSSSHAISQKNPIFLDP